MRRACKIGWVVVVLALLQACASTSPVAGGKPDARDPWEDMNRKVFAFNEKLDQAVMRPVAQAYVDVVPSFMRAGVRNFLSNLGDVWTAVNATLQFKGQAAVETIMRLAVNSTFGFYGVLDIATQAGIPKHKEDLGQTLGHWSIQPGPYLVLPVLGPSTLRDTAGMSVDVSPSQYFSDSKTRTGLTLLSATESRARLLNVGETVRAASLDPYSFVREGWLQKRQSDVYDGNPPSTFDYADPAAP